MSIVYRYFGIDFSGKPDLLPVLLSDETDLLLDETPVFLLVEENDSLRVLFSEETDLLLPEPDGS